MFDYIVKFLIGGTILVLATYFSKSKNIFFAGVITTLPLMTLANMSLQLKLLNREEFIESQKSGMFGALGLALFIFGCYLLSQWMRPLYAIFVSLGVYLLYIVAYKYLS